MPTKKLFLNGGCPQKVEKRANLALRSIGRAKSAILNSVLFLGRVLILVGVDDQFVLNLLVCVFVDV